MKTRKVICQNVYSVFYIGNIIRAVVAIEGNNDKAETQGGLVGNDPLAAVTHEQGDPVTTLQSQALDGLVPAGHLGEYP